MNKKLIIASGITILLTLPLSILAFDPGPQPGQNNEINVNQLIQIIFNILWPVAVAFFIVMFIVAAFQFATAGGDPEKIKTARNFVIWGIVGVVIAVLAFSLPNIVRNQLGF